jgi:hypothetical protein
MHRSTSYGEGFRSALHTLKKVVSPALTSGLCPKQSSHCDIDQIHMNQWKEVQ